LRKAAVSLSVELLEALEECILTLQKLSDLLREDREDIPECVNGEILKEYLRGADAAHEMISSMLESIQEILAGT